MTDEQIRAIFMAHGFTIKDGQADLKPYVYEAARALLSASKRGETMGSGVDHFNYLCSLLPSDFHWSDPLTPAVLSHIVSKIDAPSPSNSGDQIGARMPNGDVVTNVYEAFESGKRPAAPAQSGEPVAWMYSSSRGVDLDRMRWSDDMKALGPADMVETPLYAAPQSAQTAQSGEPVAEVIKWRTFPGHTAWDLKVFDKTLKHGAKLYAGPQPSRTVVALDDVQERALKWAIAQAAKDYDGTHWRALKRLRSAILSVAQPVEQTRALTGDASECLADVVSHYRALYAGLAFQLNEANGTENPDDMAYWKHEIKALERMYAQAERALTDAQSTTRALTDWHPIETAPEGMMVLVGWVDQEDGNHCHDFDWLEDGVWQKHSEHYEWAYSVAPSGSQMPSEHAPYTHWMALQDVPTTARPASGETA